MDPSFLTDVANYGLAVVIAVYLVWWVTKNLNSKLDRLAQNMEQLNNNMKQLSLSIEKLLDKLTKG